MDRDPPQYTTPAHGFPSGQQFMPSHVTPHNAWSPSSFYACTVPNIIRGHSKICEGGEICIHDVLKEMMNEITEPLHEEIKALKEKKKTDN